MHYERLLKRLETEAEKRGSASLEDLAPALLGLRRAGALRVVRGDRNLFSRFLTPLDAEGGA
jgi:hypothetical protein